MVAIQFYVIEINEFMCLNDAQPGLDFSLVRTEHGGSQAEIEVNDPVGPLGTRLREDEKIERLLRVVETEEPTEDVRVDPEPGERRPVGARHVLVPI